MTTKPPLALRHRGRHKRGEAMSRAKTRIEDCTVQRAALYIRVSTEEQAMHGLSLTAQRETLTRYVAENGLRLVGAYVDEGITARKKYKNRAAFMRMLRDVEEDKIDLILFIKLDRWFRSIADYYEVQKILDAHNVRWIATEESYDTTTANGRLHLNIKLSIAQDESDRTSERIKFVFDSKVKRGEVISGKAPLGYRIENKRLCPDPATAPIAQDIFSKYLVLRSIRSLRQYMMEQYGLIYAHTSIHAMLQNERYIGRAHGQDDFCPPLIDPQTFAQAQRLMEERAQRNSKLRPDWVYLFTGLVYCAECGNRLSAHTVGGKYIYYRCTRYEKLHLCEHKKRTSELVLEDWLVHNLVSQMAEYNIGLEAQGAKPKKVVDEAKLKRKMEKLKDLYLNDLIDRDTYERDYTALRDELRSAAIEEARPQPVDLERLSNSLQFYGELSKPLKKEFWCRVLGKIFITNGDGFFVVPS